jgi:SAM-dependent methyltransferase
MNEQVRRFTLSGMVVDVGGGRYPSYMDCFLRRIPFERISVDRVTHADTLSRLIDIERDPLPFADGTADNVLLFNILEHVFEYGHVLREVRRILKLNGVVYGFVPFLINYHPDPHDFFRYTHESLRRLFGNAGFEVVELASVGDGPFSVAYNTFTSIAAPLSFFLAVLYPVAYALDRFYGAFRSSVRERFPLGYFFVLHQNNI